jgi:hypothetical protein
MLNFQAGFTGSQWQSGIQNYLRGPRLLDILLGWITQSPLLAKPKSTGGYHTVFRGVKHVTVSVNGKSVNFSTESLSSRDTDATLPVEVVRILLNARKAPMDAKT